VDESILPAMLDSVNGTGECSAFDKAMAFLVAGRDLAIMKIGACQSRADQQAPFQQRSLHTFVSERL
jgi:hypothetical protein